MSRLAAAHDQYETENADASNAELLAVYNYASLLKSQYLTTESGAELSAIVGLLHDNCMVEQLIARCFKDRDNLLDHLNDFLRAAAGHADFMASTDAENTDYNTICVALWEAL